MSVNLKVHSDLECAFTGLISAWYEASKPEVSRTDSEWIALFHERLDLLRAAFSRFRWSVPEESLDPGEPDEPDEPDETASRHWTLELNATTVRQLTSQLNEFVQTYGKQRNEDICFHHLADANLTSRMYDLETRLVAIERHLAKPIMSKEQIDKEAKS